MKSTSVSVFKDRLSSVCLSLRSSQYHMIKVLLLGAFRGIKNRTVSLALVLPQHFASRPPPLAPAIIWLVFFMHAHAFMPHIGFADKNRGEK